MNAPAGRPQIYRFGVFELDTLAHELRKQGARVRLQDQPYQILLLLLERAGQLVTRDELRQPLWPSSVYVDFDHGLNNAIARLREVLGDAASTPRFIETLPRLGYRFICPVESTAAAAPRKVIRTRLTNLSSPYLCTRRMTLRRNRQTKTPRPPMMKIRRLRFVAMEYFAGTIVASSAQDYCGSRVPGVGTGLLACAA